MNPAPHKVMNFGFRIFFMVCYTFVLFSISQSLYMNSTFTLVKALKVVSRDRE